MAGKRHLESLDPVTYNKLSRLETEPNGILAAGLCKSSPVPSHGSENHLSYKGTYFAYPLQNPNGTESLTHWSPAASYMQYPGNAVSQHLRTDGTLMNCLLYGRDAESLGARLQSSGADKGKDSMVRDLLMVQEKWANHMGQQDPLQQVQGHAFPVQKPVLINKAGAQTPTGCATLAVPKPVYRSPICYVDPRASMSLQTQMEAMQKRPLEVEWTLPTPVSSGHHIHAKDQHCVTAVHKRAHHPDPSFLQLHQGTGVPSKESVATSAGFSPYHAAFEKYQARQSTFLLEANYPAMYNNQKRVAEAHGSSLTQHTWSKLQPSAASPLVHSQAAAYRDRSPACYQLSHYPLTSHKQTLFYQEAPHAEEQSGALLAMPASGGYKGINFPGSGEPRPFSSTYLRHHYPRGYYPSPLESYMYSTAGQIPGAPPTLKPGVPSGEPALEQNSSCKVDHLQQNASYAFSPSDMALYTDSLANTEAGHEWHVDSSRVAAFQGTPPMRESPRSKQVASQQSAFQPICALARPPSSSDRLTDPLPKRETGYGVGLGQTEQPSMHGKEQSHSERRPTLSMKEPTPRNTGVQEAPVGAPIVITDSPVSYHHRKREAPKVKDFTEGRVSSPQTLSSEERLKSLKNAENSPPSSPPMPVINNVFSLAPYRDYIEGSKESAEIPVSKGHQEEDPPFKNAGTSLGSGDSKAASKPPSAKDTSEKPIVLPAGKKAIQALKAEPGMGGNCNVIQREGSCCNRTCESYKPKILPRSLPARSEPGTRNGSLRSPATPGNGELAQDDVVLDLSLKRELVKANHPMSQARQTKVIPRGESGGEEEEKEGPRKKQRVFESSKSQALLVENSSGDKSNFQSSAAFMFKKYKLLKSVPARAVPLIQANGPPAAATQANGPPAAATQASGPPAAATQANGPPAAATQANGPPAAAMQGPPAAVQVNSPPAGVAQGPPAATTQPDTQPLQMTCLYLKLPDISKSLPPSAPEAFPALGEANVSLPSNCESPAQQTSSSQYFIALHVSLCNVISCSVSGTSLELLQEWLRRAELDGEQKERPKSPLQHKNGSRIMEAQKPSKGKEIWLGFKDVSVLLRKLLSQLETFMFTRKCPFPHVVRAGAIFIPIHVVKEKLFPNLSGASVDHVLQEHKVELRPTTLSEEKLLRDLELKCCTSRMLKLLALKQLPDVYPDLLNLHWHDCVKQHLSEPGTGTLKDEGKSVAVDYVKKKATGGLMGATTGTPVNLFKGKYRKGKFLILSKWGSPFQEGAATREPEKTQPLDEKPQGNCSPPVGGDALLMDGRASPQVDPSSLDSKPNRLPLHSGAKQQLSQPSKPCRTLELKLTSKASRKTRSTSRVLHLRNSMVRIKFQRVPQGVQRTPLHGAQGRCPASRQGCSLLRKTFRHEAESPTSPSRYPELVGKRIRHLYEEKDKTEAWYQGVVLRIHKPHKNPLRSVYEVKYDSEPERQYYLEILQDYKKGWLEVDE